MTVFAVGTSKRKTTRRKRISIHEKNISSLTRLYSNPIYKSLFNKFIDDFTDVCMNEVKMDFGVVGGVMFAQNPLNSSNASFLKAPTDCRPPKNLKIPFICDSSSLKHFFAALSSLLLAISFNRIQSASSNRLASAFILCKFQFSASARRSMKSNAGRDSFTFNWEYIRNKL